MSRRQAETFQPEPEQLALFPDVSGNVINGVDENTVRRPTPVYWHRPEKIAHGALQQWMIERFISEPDLANVHSRFGGRGPRESGPVAPSQEDDTPAGWTKRVKDFALSHEADLVGVARIDPSWVFEGYELVSSWIVILGLAMDHARLVTAPANPAGIEVQAQYNRGARAARALADWIRSRGFTADPHAGPWAGPLTLIPAALAAGFGELGKHGSIINRQYGSSFRLAGVTTELPLIADLPDFFGADDFCTHCRVCTDACPPDAIAHAKRTVRGTKKWYVDFDECILYFVENKGCGICIGQCPWSRTGTAPRLADKLARHAVAKR